MFHGVIHKITLAQFFLRHGVYVEYGGLFGCVQYVYMPFSGLCSIICSIAAETERGIDVTYSFTRKLLRLKIITQSEMARFERWSIFWHLKLMCSVNVTIF